MYSFISNKSYKSSIQRIWMDRNILDDQKWDLIQTRVDSVVVPPGLGPGSLLSQQISGRIGPFTILSLLCMMYLGNQIWNVGVTLY